MYDDIAKIIKSNKKIEDLFEIEEEINEIKRKINDIDNLSEDNDKYDKLMCEISVKEMKMKYIKEKLDSDSLDLYENIRIFSKFNKLTAKIKEIEKRSKKSNNLVLTENSEGRKKEIDGNLVDFYNICVKKKKKLSKDFNKAIKFLGNYESKKEEKIIEEIKEEKKSEVKKVEEKNNYVGIANISYTNPALEKKNTTEEEPQENKKKVIPFMSRIKKLAIGAAVGLVALVSVISFGGSKGTKNTTNNVRVEKETDAKDEMTETKNEVSVEKQIDTILAAENKIKETDELPIIETDQAIVDEVKIEEDSKLTIGDNLTVSENSRIMRNQYDATNYENGLRPYYDNDEERTIEGVVYRFSDGTIKTARSEEDVINFQSIDGAEVTAYLTYSKYGVEGFYSIQDVENNKVLSRTK